MTKQGEEFANYTFGLSDDEISERFKKAVELENEEKRIMKIPLPKYDEEKQEAYLEYPDGTKEVVCKKESR